MKYYVDFQWGEGGGTVLGNRVLVGCGEGVGILKICCMPDLNLTPRFKYITLLCCQLREILRIHIHTILFHENYQPVQGWNPTITV